MAKHSRGSISAPALPPGRRSQLLSLQRSRLLRIASREISRRERDIYAGRIDHHPRPRQVRNNKTEVSGNAVYNNRALSERNATVTARLADRKPSREAAERGTHAHFSDGRDVGDFNAGNLSGRPFEDGRLHSFVSHSFGIA